MAEEKKDEGSTRKCLLEIAAERREIREERINKFEQDADDEQQYYKKMMDVITNLNSFLIQSAENEKLLLQLIKNDQEYKRQKLNTDH